MELYDLTWLNVEQLSTVIRQINEIRMLIRSPEYDKLGSGENILYNTLGAERIRAKKMIRELENC